MLTEFKTQIKSKENKIKDISSHIQDLHKAKDSQLAEIEQYTGAYRVRIAESVEEETRKIEDKLRKL